MWENLELKGICPISADYGIHKSNPTLKKLVYYSPSFERATDPVKAISAMQSCFPEIVRKKKTPTSDFVSNFAKSNDPV